MEFISNHILEMMMKLEEVKQRIESAHSRGERPNLIGLDLSGLDLSDLDLSDAILQDSHLAGMYKPHSEPVPSPPRKRAKYNSETIFPKGFDRYD